MFNSNEYTDFFKSVENEKKREIFEEGKTPFERSEGALKVFAWRAAAIAIISGLCSVLYLITKVLNYIYQNSKSLDFYIIAPLTLLAMIGVILFAGEMCFKLVTKKNPTYEFAFLMKPLVFFFLAVSFVLGGVALGMFGATHR